jgi:hypothetical protein
MALPSFECVLCSLQVDETLEHLFLECSFAQAAWGLLNLNLPLGPLFEILESFKVQLGVNFFYGYYHYFKLVHLDGKK